MARSYISSEKENRPAWTRWFIPSIADLIFIALLGVLTCTNLAVRLLGDAGIGWHIRTGQLILFTHAIPHVDPFSSSMAGQPWFAWEWLYDALVGGLASAAGLNAVVVFTAFVIALTFSWTFRLLLRRSTNLFVALGLVLLAASASMIHFLSRPHVVSWLLTITWFWVLFSTGEKQLPSVQVPRRTRSLWLLPPLMVLWVNIHGGFLLGFALLGIYFLSAVWAWLQPSGDRFEDVLEKIVQAKRIRSLALVGILSTLATFVNPYGWRLHVHVYRYLSNRFLMDHIDEFQSPNFHGAAQKCFAILLLLTLVALAMKKRGTGGVETSEVHAVEVHAGEVHISDALIVLFAVYSGLYASRNIPVSALLLILVIGPSLSNAFQTLFERFKKPPIASRSQSASPNFLSRMQAIDSSLRGHLWPIAVIALTCWIAFHGGKLGSKLLMDAHFDSRRFPIGAVDYFQTHNLPQSIFAPDSWGGYLIYRLYPPTKVVVDDRHDFYGELFLKSYLKTMHVEPGWQDFLHDQNVRCIVVPKDSALAGILLETPQWRPIYTDDVAIAFILPLPTMQTPSH